MNETQKYLKSIGFRLNKDVTEEERQRRNEEWKSLIIGREFPHDNTARRING